MCNNTSSGIVTRFRNSTQRMTLLKRQKRPGSVCTCRGYCEHCTAADATATVGCGDGAVLLSLCFPLHGVIQTNYN